MNFFNYTQKVSITQFQQEARVNHIPQNPQVDLSRMSCSPVDKEYILKFSYSLQIDKHTHK